MTTSAEPAHAYAGPAILSVGFRPFFLGGALWAALVVAIWLPVLSGTLTLPSAFTPFEWHVHELIWGYIPAIIAGFLLTAVPNWTGRAPIAGRSLLLLFLVWVLGRAAVFFSLWLSPELAAAADLFFLIALGATVARELIAGDNRRNLKLLAVIGLLLAGNGLFHWQAITQTGNGEGTRLGIAAVLVLIMLIGGRIIPSFTRNWLAARDKGRLPANFDRMDAALIAISAVALVAWIAVPEHKATAFLFVIAGCANLVRLGRWAGERTLSEPLVLILHFAFAFVPLGFLLMALAIQWPGVLLQSGAVHAWTSGAIALITLAVMTRASLGHVGRPLTATWPVQLIYAAALLAVGARLVAAFDILREPLLQLSAAAWVAAFLGFVVVFGPLLITQRS